MKNILVSTSLVALITIVTGCGGDEKRPPSSVAIQPKTTTTAASPPGKDPARSGEVNVSEEIRRICNIEVPSGPAPHFDLDSAEVQDADRSILAQVAKCFSTGPLRGRSMRLTGHADKRGEQEYNQSLGETRASNVSGYLASLGVEKAKMGVTSRGELDATGTDETGYRLDRRVDIDLVK